MFFPFLWMIGSALKNSQEIFQLPPTLWPQSPQWSNFKLIWAQTRLARWFLNSCIHIGGVMGLQITISSLGAYALAKLDLPRKEWLLLFFIGTMMIPDEMLLVPLYNIMQAFPGFGGRGINLLNSYWALILPFTAWGYTLYLLYGFFSQLPDELLEAAKIDGASELRIFGTIVLPLSKAAMAVVGLFTFMGVWNMFLYPMVVAPAEKMWTVMVGVYMLQTSSLQWNQIMAALTLVAIPPLAMFLFFQRHLTQGIVMTGLKG